jgi:hypothetical protein
MDLSSTALPSSDDDNKQTVTGSRRLGHMPGVVRQVQQRSGLAQFDALSSQFALARVHLAQPRLKICEMKLKVT